MRRVSWEEDNTLQDKNFSTCYRGFIMSKSNGADFCVLNNEIASEFFLLHYRLLYIYSGLRLIAL